MFKLTTLFVVFMLGCGFIAAELGESFFGTEKFKEESCSGDRDCNVAANEQVLPFKKSTNSPTETNDITTDEINLILTFTNAVGNSKLQEHFTLTVSTLMKFASLPLAIHIIGEPESQQLARNIIAKQAGNAKIRMVDLDVDALAHRLIDIVSPMQDRFSYKPGAYYNHALFFLSIAIHRVMPSNMQRVLMIDADLKFTDDIKLLYDQFNHFQDTHIMGLAREMQPVYRHLFWKVRNENKGTRIGEPPPSGLTGFNSGVVLLDLERMRSSDLYNSYLLKDKLDALAEELSFKGHLGDQDFFTLLNMKHEELFYVLPCVFNRQLCTWWRDNGYKEVFDMYHNCVGDIVIYHGNCKTPIP